MITATDQFAPARPVDPRIVPIIDHYQALVHRILSETSERQALASLGVTSSGDAEGVSTVAAGLAITAASLSTQPVLLLDMNPSEVKHAGALHVWRQMGILDTSSPTATATSGVRRSRYDNLSVLSCRDAEQLKPPPFDRTRIEQLLRDLGEDFGLIIVDLPPATESSLALATAGLLSGVLLVIEAEQTRSESAQRAKQYLQQSQANLLGAVLNKRPQHIPDWLYARL